jgi:aminoglycoside/choline kinase family phosphotransferase
MINDRRIEIAAFLDQHRWTEASAHPFEGDFSPRRYARLTKSNGDTAILMDADHDQNTPQFVSIAKILRDCGIAAPEIIAADVGTGLALIEDFGRRNVGAALDAGGDLKPFFLRAAELLANLHSKFELTDVAKLDLPLFTPDLFTKQAELFLDSYHPFVEEEDLSDEQRADFRAAWLAVLHPLETLQKSLLLRDLMPDNLMDLRGGKLGVLDFQDAGIGPIAYDLASLCEEVRRDGGFALLPDVVAHYLKTLESIGSKSLGNSGKLTQASLMRACTILSAQRHTRVLGIIVKYTLRTGKRDKLAFVPRIKNHLKNILRQPYLMPISAWMESNNAL